MREEMGRTTLGALKATLILAPIAVAIGAVTAIEAAEWRQVTHLVAFFPAASETRPEGFVRIVNNSAEAGAVTIVAVDDAGSASDELTLTLGANGTVGLDAEDLEAGAPDAGLTGSAGTGQGDWRLRLTSDLDIEPQVFARTPDGALWEMHETAPVADGVYRIATFNPGSNANQVGRLRLVNPGDEPAAVTIRGTDDSGASRSPGVRLEIPPGEAESLTAAELESGVASGLEGSLGDGAGKWRLDIESSVLVRVMSLVSSPTGHLTNLSTVPALESGGTHRVPLFPPFSDPYRQGFARVVNRSDAAGEVRIEAFDDTPRTYEALTLSMGARETRHFNSQDLELGNADKGLTGSTGAGEGDWRLELTSDLDIEVLSYVRTVGGQGYVTPMHDSAPRESGGLMRYYVPVFHPPKYEGQESRLHLVNLGESEARVGIAGLDDAGAAPPAGDVSLVLGPWETRVVTSEQLEDGGQGLDGRIGSGEGRWRLFVSSQEALQVMSLGYSADGFMANLSRASPPASDVPVVAPDLVVEIPWVSDGAPEAGQAFTFSARVGNRGDGDAGATTLRYYRSANANISASDLEVGNDRVNALSASESSAASLTLNAPEDPGTYYYGACADAVPDESDTTNNCSAGLPVTVSEPGASNAPDLVVSVSVDNDTPDAGGEFELTATVRNVGDGASSSTTLRYYRSRDATITKADTEQGINAMHALSASESSGASLTLNAPEDPGTYYYGACADAVPDESDTTNNCSAGLPITVSEPNAPDLVVSVSVDNDTPDTGGEFELTATVRNVGDGAASSTTLRYYRSSDATITTADTEQGIDAMHALSASESSGASLTLNAPQNPGTYYYGACADAVPDESDTTNNCSAGLPITVSEPNAPDLVVSVSLDNDTPDAGGEFELTATVRNVGDGASSSTTLRYYRSSDATITTADTEQGIDAMHALSASESSRASLTLNAPEDPGTYYYGACADAVPDESDTTNNCSAGLPITVSEPNAPDLVVSVSVDNDTPDAGGEFELTATVRNVGDGASSSTTLRYYRSSDATITTADTEQGIDAMHALSASESSGASLTLNAPQNPGTYYYGACADVVPDESDTANNCSAGLPVAVAEPVSDPPDLVVSASVDNGTPDAGREFELTATVRNVGDGASAATMLHYYKSSDATISAADIRLGTHSVDALDASGMSTGSIARKVPTSAGTDYYGACVDAVPNESDTTNNCSAAVAVTPQSLGPPDLVVGVTAGSDISGLRPGHSLTVNARVTNVGDGPSALTTLRYYWSTDDTITTSDTEEATDSVSVLPTNGSSAASAELTAPSEPGTHYFGACVDAVPDESDTTNNCSPALAATVNPSRPPDLGIWAMSSHCSTHWYGEDAELRGRVSNWGETRSPPSTRRFYLHSGNPSAKVQVATREVKSLAKRFTEPWWEGSQDDVVEVPVPTTLGRYTQIQCVDVVDGETNTGNNCASKFAFDVVNVTHMGNLDLTVPEGCPLEAKFCLNTDLFGHWQPGGLVRFNLNGSAILSTKKKDDRICATASVNVGSNSMQVDVVSLTEEMLCPPSGRLDVQASNAASASWHIPIGSSTTSNLKVSVGAQGTCPGEI